MVGGHLCGDRQAQAASPVSRHLDATVEILDLGFELVGGDVALLAAGAVAAVLLAEAVEVGVGALGVLDRQAPAAHPADEQALQVVVMAALTRAAHGPSGEQLLDPLEGGPIHQ
ncbi:MAG: hypothetical protein M0020_01375 [Actinomycetota bacterium]|nr:hypothetical protein [Actinomycetota bacterium]